MKRLGIVTGVLVILATTGWAQPGPLDKKISVSYTGIQLSEALKDIEQRAGLKLAFTEKLVATADPVSFEATDQEAGRVLTRILRPRRLNLQVKDGGPAAVVALDDRDEFKPKPEPVSEFAEKPAIVRNGDQVTIRFTAKGFCDATVVIEDANGRIIRHLASGVLGDNAPEPFRWNTRQQELVWDGKDDLGAYVDDKQSHTVRVSLGLAPRFERTLFWHPKKRVGLLRNGSICPRPEGVYVYQGAGVEMVRLYTHGGEYVRTVYPHPADKVREAKGLEWRKGYDGFEYPQKQGGWRTTLTTGGTGFHHGWGGAAYSAAVAGSRIAICGEELGRLGTDGTTGGLEYKGPSLYRTVPKSDFHWGPHSSALSPDGRFLYLTGFYQNTRPLGGPIQIPSYAWRHGLYRVEFEKNDPPVLWLGDDEKRGNGELELDMPSGVCCDAQGNVYVADFFNNRVRVFSPDRKLLKNIEVDGPAQVQVHHQTGEIYIFSWPQPDRSVKLKAIQPMMRRFGPLGNPALRAEVPLPLESWSSSGWGMMADEVPIRAALDSWAEPATIWLIPGWPQVRSPDSPPGPNDGGIRLYQEKDGKLQPVDNFQADVAKAGIRLWPTRFQRQRLYVDPRNGMLYLGEADTGANMGLTQLLRIDPDSGRTARVNLPIPTEDLCMDVNGFAYLRACSLRQDAIGRFEIDSWQEIPYDYGEEQGEEYFEDKKTEVTSALMLPSLRPVYWHQSGLGVTPGGDLVVSCYNQEDEREKSYTDGASEADRIAARKRSTVKRYQPRLYPGRFRYGEVHIWDKHGKMKQQDIIPGLPDGHGTQIDLNGDVYVLIACHQLVNGSEKYGEMEGTILKFRPGKGRLISSGSCPAPLTDATRPRRLPQLQSFGVGAAMKDVWVEGAEWMYSGIGVARPGAPCQCWNTRFVVDYLGRSFAPETSRCQVAVLDTNGNLILRIGRYGNVEDGVPLVKDGGPKEPRSIGGDETSFVYPVYVAAHTDRRLYVADPGNGRIVSVKLGYRAEEKVALKDVKDEGKK